MEGDLFAILGRIILYQQLATKAADTILSRLVALYPGQDFPAATQLMETSDDQLRSVGVSRQKISYLRDLAQRSPQLPTVDQLASLSDADIVQALTQVKGIGRWSVEMLLMFRLGRLDVMPVDDLGIRAAVARLYGLEGPPPRKRTQPAGTPPDPAATRPPLPSARQLETLSEPWRPYRTVACWYLWKSLDSGVLKTRKLAEEEGSWGQDGGEGAG